MHPPNTHPHVSPPVARKRRAIPRGALWFWLGALPFGLVSAPASADPGPELLYANTSTGECGYLWLGDEFVIQTPADDRYLPIPRHQVGPEGRTPAPLLNEARCTIGVEIVLTEHVLPEWDDPALAPCDRLRRLTQWGIPVAEETRRATCEALGLQYVGRIAHQSAPGHAAGPLGIEWSKWWVGGGTLFAAILVAAAVLLIGRRKGA